MGPKWCFEAFLESASFLFNNPDYFADKKDDVYWTDLEKTSHFDISDCPNFPFPSHFSLPL